MIFIYCGMALLFYDIGKLNGIGKTAWKCRL